MASMAALQGPPRFFQQFERLFGTSFSLYTSRCWLGIKKTLVKRWTRLMAMTHLSQSHEPIEPCRTLATAVTLAMCRHLPSWVSSAKAQLEQYPSEAFHIFESEKTRVNDQQNTWTIKLKIKKKDLQCLSLKIWSEDWTALILTKRSVASPIKKSHE